MSGNGPMDAFVVDRGTADAVQQAKAHMEELLQMKVERTTFNGEDVKCITEFAHREARSTKSAASWWNRNNPQRPVSVPTVYKYLKHFEEHGTYFTPQKRGAKRLLDDADLLVLSLAFDSFRREGIAVSASLFAGVARGVVTKSKPYLFKTKQEGVLEFSPKWACGQMTSMGLMVRAGTTDRSVSAKRIVDEGRTFYQAIRDAAPTRPEMLFNMDEFFCILDGAGAQSKWTWERVKRGERKNIFIKDDRLGFTMSVLSDAAGGVPLLQMIWKGKTRDVEAKVNDDEVCAQIMQDHNENSHFQTGATYQRWMDAFQKIVNARMLSAADYAVLVVDAATQHTPVALPNIRTVYVPKNCTHCFQPADMFIISNLKKKCKEAWAAWIAKLFSTKSVEEAVKCVVERHVKTRRAAKYRFVAQALKELGAESVIKSWAVAGILQAAFNTHLHHPTFYDKYVETHRMDPSAVIGDDNGGDNGGDNDGDNDGDNGGDNGGDNDGDNGGDNLVAGKQVAPAEPVGVVAPKRSVGRPKKIIPLLAGQQTLTAFFKRPREE